MGRVSPLIAAVTLLLAASAGSLELPDDGFIDVVGGRVVFRVIGGGRGTPLLVIQGGPGGSSCSYASTLTGIAAERPVIIYDQLGSGYSDRITDLKQQAVLSRFVSELPSIRQELGLDQIHLLGQSWGAAVALEYLLTANPTGVRSVTFAGPLIGTQRWLSDASILLARLFGETQTAVRTASATGDFGTAEFGAADSTYWAEYGVRTPSHMLDWADCDRKPGGNSGLYGYMLGPCEFLCTGTLRDYDRINRLPELNLPVLWLVGEYDEARPETVREFQALVPGSALTVIPNAGHVSHLDQPRAFNGAVSEFIRRVEHP
jgi:proline iminopeptidase